MVHKNTFDFHLQKKANYRVRKFSKILRTIDTKDIGRKLLTVRMSYFKSERPINTEFKDEKILVLR